MSVGELSARLKRVVEGEFGHVRVRGEISGYKRVASGHAYLCLKDDSAVIDGVMWKGTTARLAEDHFVTTTTTAITIITAVTMTRMMIAIWYRYARPKTLPI